MQFIADWIKGNFEHHSLGQCAYLFQRDTPIYLRGREERGRKGERNFIDNQVDVGKYNALRGRGRYVRTITKPEGMRLSLTVMLGTSSPLSLIPTLVRPESFFLLCGERTGIVFMFSSLFASPPASHVEDS